MQTVILNGKGPAIKVTLPDKGKVTVINKDSAKDIEIDKKTKVKFSAA